MSITIQNIADELNVSASTVSRSLRNDRLIKPQTRAKVQATAANMGYQGRIRRKGMRRRLATSLKIHAILASETVDSGSISSNYIKFMEGIEAEADAMDVQIKYHAIGHQLRGHLTAKDLPKNITSGKTDAIILIGPESPKDVELIASYAPIISLQWSYQATPCDLVLCQDSDGITYMVDHLVQMGHRNIRWIDDVQPNPTPATQRRLAGFLRALINHKIPFDHNMFEQSHQLYADFDPALPYLQDYTQGITNPKILHQWIEEQKVTALVCASDRVANNVILNLQKLGINIPEQISVTGFDNEPTPKGFPKLTSIEPMFMEMGRTALRIAQQRVERPTAFSQCIQHVNRLIIGQSTTQIK